MRPGGCDDLQAALGCVDALRESVPALHGQELLDAVCGMEVLARKAHATMLELVAGVDAAGVAGEQGFGATWRLLSAMLDLSAGQARARVRDAEQLATRRTLTGEVSGRCGALLRRTPLRTVHATRRRTRLKQAPRACG